MHVCQGDINRDRIAWNVGYTYCQDCGKSIIIRDGQDQLGGKLFLSSILQKYSIYSFNSQGKLVSFLFSLQNIHKTSISLTDPFVGKDKGQKVPPRILAQARLPIFSCCVLIFFLLGNHLFSKKLYAIYLLFPRSFQNWDSAILNEITIAFNPITVASDHLDTWPLPWNRILIKKSNYWLTEHQPTVSLSNSS